MKLTLAVGSVAVAFATTTGTRRIRTTRQPVQTLISENAMFLNDGLSTFGSLDATDGVLESTIDTSASQDRAAWSQFANFGQYYDASTYPGYTGSMSAWEQPVAMTYSAPMPAWEAWEQPVSMIYPTPMATSVANWWEQGEGMLGDGSFQGWEAPVVMPDWSSFQAWEPPVVTTPFQWESVGMPSWEQPTDWSFQGWEQPIMPASESEWTWQQPASWEVGAWEQPSVAAPMYWTPPMTGVATPWEEVSRVSGMYNDVMYGGSNSASIYGAMYGPTRVTQPGVSVLYDGIGKHPHQSAPTGSTWWAKSTFTHEGAPSLRGTVTPATMTVSPSSNGMTTPSAPPFPLTTGVVGWNAAPANPWAGWNGDGF